MKETFMIIMISCLFFLHTSILQAVELDLSGAQNAVGQRFASKFCEAKQQGFSTESSSEFALNNTYLKFASFPDDENFIEVLWEFTISKIAKDCGDYITKTEEEYLSDFFQEEGKIASNRDLYLPH